MKIWDENWLDGAEAHDADMSYWQNPFTPGTHAYQQWASGWESADFDHRAEEQFAIMETVNGQNTATH